MEGGRAERGGFAQKIAGGLRPWQPEQDDERFERSWREIPAKGQAKYIGLDGFYPTRAARAIDQSCVKTSSDLASENGEQMDRPGVGPRQRSRGLLSSEQNNVNKPETGDAAWRNGRSANNPGAAA